MHISLIEILILQVSLPLSKLVQPLRQTTTVAQLSPEISLRAQKIVGGWLIGCAGLCFGAVVLGGVTRLVIYVINRLNMT